MALGRYPYEPGYPAEFLIGLTEKLLPELKDLMKSNGVDKECIDSCNRLIKMIKNKELKA